MAVPDTKTLLALFLALKDLDTLSEDERASLRNTADQLQQDRDNWQDHESDLLTTIQANSQFNLLYQTYKSQLDAVQGEIPSDLLPTQAEVEQVAPIPNTQPRSRAPLQVNPSDLKSNEITNMAIRVLTTPNPVETTKKINSFKQIQNFLTQRVVEQ